MIILTLEELEPYKGLRVLDTESIYGISRRTLSKLQTFEQQLLDEGSRYGVPYFVALELHVNGQEISEVAQKFGIIDGSYSVSKMLEHYGIPTLSSGEEAKRHSYPKEPNGTKAVAYPSGDDKDTKYSNPSLVIGSMMSEACPKCHGNLFVLNDLYGSYLGCIQCGHHIYDVDTGHSNGVAVS